MAGSNLQETLQAASEVHGEAVVALRTYRGAIISDVSVLRQVDDACVHMYSASDVSLPLPTFNTVSLPLPTFCV